MIAYRLCRILPLVFLLMAGTANAQVLTGFDEEDTTEVAINDVAPDTTSPKQAALKAEGLPGIGAGDEPVNLDAEQLIHDEESQTVTATGNVFLTQAGRILRADEIKYDIQSDTAVATGHVVLNEENGDIHYADKVKFNEKLKNGFVKGLKVYLADGSRFTARDGKRIGGTKTVMKDAAYTPCEACKADPEKPPLWQIRASEVQHDETGKSVSYKNARFEVKGIPIAYVPYFSHPDGTVKRKSGLLAPSGGFKSDLGTFMTNRYYFDIAPDKDATLGLMAFTGEGPLVFGEWRQRWENAGIELSGGITSSSRIDRTGGISVKEDDELRGHVLGKGEWDIDEKWRAGTNIAWASDDQYMRQYDFSDERVLTNEVYAERFSGRNYAAGRLLTFQDIRVEDRQVDQPEVVPEILASFKGEPASVPVIGGRWGLDGSFLGLRREGSNQDMNRLSVLGNWQRRLVSDYGLLTTADASLRGDLYNTRDRTIATPVSGLDDSVTAARYMPRLHMQSSYPMAKTMETMQATIEPVVALTIAPNIDINEDIPNEDSQDVQIDASNLFEPDRFPGLDRIEDQSRVTYGLRAGLYTFKGNHGDVFLGQSHRLQEDDNPFPEGSGLQRQNSDIVGQVTASVRDRYNLSYRFQIASDTLASERHEVDAGAEWGRFSIDTSYLYANSLGGTDIDESREQLQVATGYYMSPDWRVRAGGTQDLGAQPGLRKAYVGLDHFGQCFSWSLLGRRNLTDNATGESDTEILFKVGLKNIGGFETSDLRKKSKDD